MIDGRASPSHLRRLRALARGRGKAALEVLGLDTQPLARVSELREAFARKADAVALQRLDDHLALVELGCRLAAGWHGPWSEPMRPDDRPPSGRVFCVLPYRVPPAWAFDDLTVGLLAEPLLRGTDALLDEWGRQWGGGGDRFVLRFSDAHFDGATTRLLWTRPDSGGGWYYDARVQQEGWLCSALLCYFRRPPRWLYVAVEPPS